MWAASLWVYDHEKMADALEWRWAELNGEPLYAWPFDSPTEVTHGHGLDEFTWSEGSVRGEYSDPYFFLNLEGRYIDAERFNQVLVRLWSEDADTMLLFHQQMREDQIHASEPIAVAAGWQTLTLSLPSLDWHVQDLADPTRPFRESNWGGAEGVVSAFRVDPVEDGAFEVDWIQLEDPDSRPNLVDEIETFETLADPLFERMRQEPGRTWHIANDEWLRTLEMAHRTRQKVAAEFPSAILFPRPPSDEQLAYPPFETGPLSAFIPASLFIAALLFLVVRDQIPPPLRSIVAVVALVVLIEAYIYWMPSLSSLWRVLLGIPVLGAVWELAPKMPPRYLLGDARAWLLVSPVLIFSLLILILAPYQGSEHFSVLKTLGSYFLWALFQQFVVAVLIRERLKPLLGRMAIVVSAGVFGLLHFPNFALMTATFLLGIGLLHVFERHQNLPAIAAAQAFLAVAFNTIALQYFWLSRTIGPAFTVAL